MKRGGQAATNGERLLLEKRDRLKNKLLNLTDEELQTIICRVIELQNQQCAQAHLILHRS